MDDGNLIENILIKFNVLLVQFSCIITLFKLHAQRSACYININVSFLFLFYYLFSSLSCYSNTKNEGVLLF